MFHPRHPQNDAALRIFDNSRSDDGDKYDDESEGETEETGGVQKSEEDNQEQACKRSGSARP